MPVNLLYAAGHDLADPYLSPLFGDFDGFPADVPASGTRDLFLSNTVRMHRQLLAAGVRAELHVLEAMPHGGFFGSAPEDAELDAAINAFLDKHRRRPHSDSCHTDRCQQADRLPILRPTVEPSQPRQSSTNCSARAWTSPQRRPILKPPMAFSDLHVTIEDLIAENDQVVVRWTARGQPRGRGRRAQMPRPPTITFHGLAKLRIGDGKIVAFGGFSDLAGDNLSTS